MIGLHKIVQNGYDIVNKIRKKWIIQFCVLVGEKRMELSFGYYRIVGVVNGERMEISGNELSKYH